MLHNNPGNLFSQAAYNYRWIVTIGSDSAGFTYGSNERRKSRAFRVAKQHWRAAFPNARAKSVNVTYGFAALDRHFAEALASVRR